MGKLRSYWKLLLALLVALTLLAAWIAVSTVSISNGLNTNISYSIQTPAEHRLHGVVRPGESRRMWKFVGEGGLRVEVRAAESHACIKDIYTVPPLGGKCEVKLSSESNKCSCRVGL